MNLSKNGSRPSALRTAMFNLVFWQPALAGLEEVRPWTAELPEKATTDGQENELCPNGISLDGVGASDSWMGDLHIFRWRLQKRPPSGDPVISFPIYQRSDSIKDSRSSLLRRRNAPSKSKSRLPRPRPASGETGNVAMLRPSSIAIRAVR